MAVSFAGMTAWHAARHYTATSDAFRSSAGRAGVRLATSARTRSSSGGPTLFQAEHAYEMAVGTRKRRPMMALAEAAE